MGADDLDQALDAHGGAEGSAVDVGLEIVGAEEENHQVERRVAGQQRRQHARPIAIGSGGKIVEHRRPTAQAFGDDPRPPAQPVLEH
jgi:hypothetical protein